MSFPSLEDKPKVAISWSSGKDSAYAYYRIGQSGEYDIRVLLTTVTDTYDRVSMHGVREVLLEEQARQAGKQLLKVVIPPDCPNEIYEDRMGEALANIKAMGIEYIVFGDIFLEDIRKYRESRLKGTGITPLFPLWGMEPKNLAREIINSGIRARIACLDPRKLGQEFAGSDFDMGLLERLPPDVDWCGENGEFHTFVYGAPFFTENIRISTGDTVEREGFCFSDIIPL